MHRPSENGLDGAAEVTATAAAPSRRQENETGEAGRSALAVAASGLRGAGDEIERDRKPLGAGALRRVRVSSGSEGGMGDGRPFPTQRTVGSGRRCVSGSEVPRNVIASLTGMR